MVPETDAEFEKWWEIFSHEQAKALADPNFRPEDYGERYFTCAVLKKMMQDAKKSTPGEGDH